jgi:hypothetical protein
MRPHEERRTLSAYRMARRSSSPRGTATCRSPQPASAPSSCPVASDGEHQKGERGPREGAGEHSVPPVAATGAQCPDTKDAQGFAARAEHHETERGLQRVRLVERQQAPQRGRPELARGSDLVENVVRYLGGAHGGVAAHEALCAAGRRARVSSAGGQRSLRGVHEGHARQGCTRRRRGPWRWTNGLLKPAG